MAFRRAVSAPVESGRAERATRMELTAWRSLSNDRDGYTMPARLFLSEEQEQEIAARHDATVAADVERTNSRTNLRTNSVRGQDDSHEGEAKVDANGGSGDGEDDEPRGLGREFQCSICYDDNCVYSDDSGIWQNGILCRGTSAGAPHFICTDCFRQHVEYDACRPRGRFESELQVQSGVSQPGEFPCPSASTTGCDCGVLATMDIYQALLGHQTSFDVFNASKQRVEIAAAVEEALAAERIQIEAERKRHQELIESPIGQVVLLVEYALIQASCMRCPEGHPGYKNNACNHMNCEANGCRQPRYCYACGQARSIGPCGCDQDGIYLQGMPGLEAANSDGNAAVVLFHFNRARAFVQVVKVMVLAAPEIDDNIWTLLHTRHPELLSSVGGLDGQDLNWAEERLPAELLQTFGSREHKERRLRAQLTQFSTKLRRQATEIGLLLPDFDEEILGIATSQLLRDGTTAEEGVRVLAARASHRGNYMIGCTGIITRLEPDNPVVRWDHSGEEHTSSKNNLILTRVRLRDGTPAACGVRVVAIASCRNGHYARGQTGIISGIHENNSNPMVRWDGDMEYMRHETSILSSCHDLNVNNVVLQDGTPAAVGVRVVVIAALDPLLLDHGVALQQTDATVGQTGVICGIHRTDPLVHWDRHSHRRNDREHHNILGLPNYQQIDRRFLNVTTRPARRQVRRPASRQEVRTHFATHRQMLRQRIGHLLRASGEEWVLASTLGLSYLQTFCVKAKDDARRAGYSSFRGAMEDAVTELWVERAGGVRFENSKFRLLAVPVVQSLGHSEMDALLAAQMMAQDVDGVAQVIDPFGEDYLYGD